MNNNTSMKMVGKPSKVFQSLVKAIELDTEWHRAVTHATYAIAIANRSPTVVSPSGASQWPFKDPHVSQESTCSFPCTQCGAVITNQSKHVLNYCGAFQDRYRWRKCNIVNYFDSLLDHNKYKVFCDLPDRKTSSGTTIPTELLPVPSGDDPHPKPTMNPDLVVVNRETYDVNIFVLSIADEAEVSDVQRRVWETYYDLIETLSARAANTFRILFHTIEIGTLTGNISESSKFALWEIYKLTPGHVPIGTYMENVVLLSKLGSFMVFKWRNDKKWNRGVPFLQPSNVVDEKREFVRDYVLPAAKLLGIVAALVALLVLLHVGYLMSGWLWANLTFKVVLFIYVMLMGLFLCLFRP